MTSLCSADLRRVNIFCFCAVFFHYILYIYHIYVDFWCKLAQAKICLLVSWLLIIIKTVFFWDFSFWCEWDSISIFFPCSCSAGAGVGVLRSLHRRVRLTSQTYHNTVLIAWESSIPVVKVNFIHTVSGLWTSQCKFKKHRAGVSNTSPARPCPQNCFIIRAIPTFKAAQVNH